MAFTKEAMKNAHSPAARAKAMATMRKNKTGMFRPKDSRHRTPAERARIVARVDALVAGGMSIDAACNKVDIHRSAIAKWKAKPHLLNVANGGTVTTIDVATLPKRASNRRRKGRHILRTPLVKAQMVAKVDALIAAGSSVKDAVKKIGFHDTQYRVWKKDKSLKAALNGYALHPVNGSAVRLVLQINGEDHTVSLQEAQHLRTGLDAVLGHITE